LSSHPDKNKAEHASETQFQLIHEAWTVLRESVSRKNYDKTLQVHESLVKVLPLLSEVDLDDMHYDDLKSCYSYPCRCSGEFKISEAQLEEGIDTIQCNNCTFAIKILYEPQNSN